MEGLGASGLAASSLTLPGFKAGAGAIETGAAAARLSYDYAELTARDKASLDIFWLRDDSLTDSDNLPPPDVIAQEIVSDLEAALEHFRQIAGDLGTVEEA